VANVHGTGFAVSDKFLPFDCGFNFRLVVTTRLTRRKHRISPQPTQARTDADIYPEDNANVKLHAALRNHTAGAINPIGHVCSAIMELVDGQQMDGAAHVQ
jgi:hypothetical protein